MINVLTVSKDRAPQLRLLLESIGTNCPHLFNKIKIVWKASTPDFQKGYEKLQEETCSLNIEWIPEQNFFNDFIEGIKNIESEYICGIVDDCVVYRPIYLKSEEIERTFGEDQFCFSLRLGANTRLQDYLNDKYQPQAKVLGVSSFEYSSGDKESIICWNWKTEGQYLNYGYPISLDGHIYRTREFYSLSTHKPFSCLREWEGFLATHIRDLTTRSIMSSPSISAIYSIPANCVQDPPMIAGVKMRYSPEKLNDLYINENKIIDLKCIKTGKEVNFCHNEMMLKMKDGGFNVL